MREQAFLDPRGEGGFDANRVSIAAGHGCVGGPRPANASSRDRRCSRRPFPTPASTRPKHRLRSPNVAAIPTPRSARSSDIKPTGLSMLDLAPNKSELEDIEIASRDEIAALQLVRLQRTLRHAYDNVPHTRAKFEAAGVHPDDCRSLSDLSKFPFTTKADLRNTYPFGMVAVPHDRLARIHASSGTTGKPTVVAYTQNDIDV